MIYVAMVFFGLVALVCFGLAAEEESCPRVILGYNCRGKECDHSAQARYRAIRARNDTNYWGDDSDK